MGFKRGHFIHGVRNRGLNLEDLPVGWEPGFKRFIRRFKIGT